MPLTLVAAWQAVLQVTLSDAEALPMVRCAVAGHSWGWLHDIYGDGFHIYRCARCGLLLPVGLIDRVTTPRSAVTNQSVF